MSENEFDAYDLDDLTERSKEVIPQYPSSNSFDMSVLKNQLYQATSKSTEDLKEDQFEYFGIFDDIKCETCGEYGLISENGIKICKSCGKDCGLYIENKPEWKSGNDSSSKDLSRCGQPENQFFSGVQLGTMISGWTGRSMLHLRRINCMNYRERTTLHALSTIRENAIMCNFPMSIIETAQHIFKNICNKDVTKGKKKRNFNAGCLMLAAHEKKYYCDITTISECFGINENEVTTAFKQIIKYVKVDYEKIRYSLVSPLSKFARLSQQLSIDIPTQHLTAKLIDKMESKYIISDNTPLSRLVGLIFLVVNILRKPITADAIYKISGVSKVTIIKTYKKLLPYTKILFYDT